MPGSQMPPGTSMNGQPGAIINKAPPPNKLPPPPPPPPPPKPARLPPPPPPPRNLSNLNISTCNTSNILNNGSSINSINSAGRCSYTQSLVGGVPMNHNHRSFMSKHGDTCSSRSSVSSHSSSLLHHHHNLNSNNNNSDNNIGNFNNNGTTNLGCACTNSNGIHCGSCNYSQENRSFAQVPCGGCCPTFNCNHHVHNVTISKCQIPSIGSSSSGVRIFNNGSSTTTISRNACNLGCLNLAQAPCGGCCPTSNGFHHVHNVTVYGHHQATAPVNQVSDASNNDPLVSTQYHTHNLSNSSQLSTTTHTSNVPVKHQPQFHSQVVSRDGRSNSSQQNEYGQSSAASTSSATPSGYDDRIPLYPSSKVHQPLSMSNSKSRPRTPQMLISSVNNSSNLQIVANDPTNLSNQFPQQQLQPNINQTFPPLPPRPTSPNASSNSTQITTLRTSPSLQNQPILRLTSQAGVQNPLPDSDVPPPLPPLNPGSRAQPLVNTLMTRVPNISDIPLNPIPSFVNLNLNRASSAVTNAERKTEALTRQIEFQLEQQQKSGEPHGICPKCSTKVMPAQDACKAMDKIYHAACFVCCECNRTLRGKTFYPVGDKVYCEEDFNYTGHMQSLEKCAACTQPIFDMILPAMGKSYHPKCFKCCICGQCLDGVPFTIDMKNKIYCVHDYHSIYSPKCAACKKSISPIDGTGETVRVVSMDKDYHIDCYCCEDCGLQLTDEEPSQSYPLDNHLLCQRCHINRLSKKSSIN